MMSIRRGFLDIEGLFPMAKPSPEAAASSIAEKVADLHAGTQAGYGKEVADAAVKLIVNPKFEIPSNLDASRVEDAIGYLTTSLEKLRAQHKKDKKEEVEVETKIQAALKEVTVNET